MNLSDSLAPSGPRLEQRVSTPAPAELTEEQKVDTQVEGLISNGLQLVYGQASEQARTSIAQARATEGDGAFGRIADRPEAFAPVENTSYAPHLHAAYAYQEWIAADRGISLPDTHLLDKLDPPAETPVSSVSERVPENERAITPAHDALRIRRLLSPEAHLMNPDASSSPFDYGVTRPDLEEIQVIVEGFPSVEWGSLVLSSLTKVEADGTSELDRWAANLMDPGIQGGFGGDERFEHYKVLAEHLDATQLDRFAQAVAHGGSVTENRWFGYAAGEAAPIASLTGLVTTMTARGRAGDESVGPLVAEAIRGLGTRDPAALGRVLTTYDRDDITWLASHTSFEQIPQSSLLSLDPQGNPVPIPTRVDATSLNRALDAISRTTNPESKALFFDAAAATMTTLSAMPSAQPPGIAYTGTQEAAEQDRDGLTLLVQSDTTGVLDQVRQIDGSGGQTVAYVEALLEGGEIDRIRDTLLHLVRGNDYSETPQGRFGSETSPSLTLDEQNNARTLGHYAGAVAAALSNVYADREAQAGALEGIFSVLTTAGLAATQPSTAVWRAARSVATAGGRSGSEALAQHIVDALDEFREGRADLSETLMDLAVPQVPNESGLTDTRSYGSPSFGNYFTTQFNNVVVHNMTDHLMPRTAR